MSECISAHALACRREKWADMRGRSKDTTAGRLFKSGFEIPVHGDNSIVAESGAWCDDLERRCHKGELR